MYTYVVYCSQKVQNAKQTKERMMIQSMTFSSVDEALDAQLGKGGSDVVELVVSNDGLDFLHGRIP